MRKTMKPVIACLALVLALVALPAVAQAATFRSGDAVVIPATEVIDDDLYVSGNAVQVLGTVNGDVVAAGQSIQISGRVADDIMAAGQTVRITGDAGGTVRAAGQDVSMSSASGRDAMLAGSTVTLSQEASVTQDAYIGAGMVLLGGTVGRNAGIGGGTVTIAGSVGGDTRVDAEKLVLAPGSTVGGDLSYSANSATVDGAVAGSTDVRPSPDELRKQHEQSGDVESGAKGGAAMGGLLFFWGVLYWFRSLFGYIIFGLIVVLVFRRFSAESADALAARPWPALGWGALVVFAFPFVWIPALLFGILLGGWWIAVLALFAWFTLLAVGLIVGALCLGRLVISRGERKPADVWPMLLALLGLWIVWLVPFVGGLIMIGTLVFGVGGVILAVAERRRSRPAETTGETGAPPVGMAPPYAEPPVEQPVAEQPMAAPEQPIAEQPATAPEPPVAGGPEAPTES
jgi:hypothetical protein